MSVREAARLLTSAEQLRAMAERLGDGDDFARKMSACMHGAARASEEQAVCELLAVAAEAIGGLFVKLGYLDVSAADTDLDADDADESGAASCAAEGTGGLVVDVTAPADDEGLHDEEGSRDE